MGNLKVFGIISILILYIFIVPIEFDVSIENNERTEVKLVNTIDEPIDDNNMASSRASTRLARENAYGGSWVDPFKDTSGIEAIVNLTLHNYRTESYDIRLTNESSNFHKIGYLQSKSFEVPKGMSLDCLIVSRTIPGNCWINVSILNASNDQPIIGPISKNGDTSIHNKIDANLYPNIKLNATFRSNGIKSPILHYWGVSWNKTNAIRDTFFTGLKGNVIDLTTGDGGVWLKASPTEWVKYSSNPIMTNGPASWDQSGVSSSYVIYNGTGYMMWFTGTGPDARIGLATSPDGITWTKYSGNPVLSVGTSSTWDSNNVATPCVIYDGQVYRMWYQGSITGTNRYNIGYATSTDGINWVKYASNPVLRSNAGDWDNGDVSAPRVIYDGVQFKMWYTGSTLTYNHRIGYATSNDGITWAKHSNNPILTNSTASTEGVGGLFVVQQNNSYLGWYNNDYDFWSEIYHAYSNNGVSWLKSQNNPVLEIGALGLWDDYTVGGPNVLLKNKRYWMYYSGYDGSNFKIGLAKSKFETTGTLSTKDITVPFNYYHDKVIINKTEPAGTYINVSIIDTDTDTAIPNYGDLRENIIDLSKLSVVQYPSIALQIEFESTGFNTPVLHDWSMVFRENIPPSVIDISSISVLNRTHTTAIKINISDIEDDECNLTLNLEYKSPMDTTWQSEYLIDQKYCNDHWESNFTPTADSELGYYSFRVTCNDYYQKSDSALYFNLTKVINNKPTKPDVKIIPPKPSSRDIFIVIAENSTDVETPTHLIKYYYKWYVNNFYRTDLDNNTFIPPQQTQKGETWRVIVYPYDGIELGTPEIAEVVIQNVPPMVDEDDDIFDAYTMFEDTHEVLENLLLTIFKDADNDTLVFNAHGQNKITVNIFQGNGTVEFIPDENWFGTEVITFSANDTYSKAALQAVLVEVKPVNDPPKIVQVGNQLTTEDAQELNFMVDEDDWLNLTIIITDIDGDVERGLSSISINISERIDLYFRDEDSTLVFNPKNSDVGFHYFNISVTDNNETPIRYVTQNIVIRVLNTNDPPTAEIILPLINSKFTPDDRISFKCKSYDDDFLVPSTKEIHLFRWFTNRTANNELGTEQNLTNISLLPGYYNITLEITDSDGANAFDYVHIYIEEIPEDKPKPTKTSTSWYWFAVLIVIIVIILAIVLFFIINRKKKKRELPEARAPGEDVIQPIASYQPPTKLEAAPTVGVGAQMVQPQAISGEPLAVGATFEHLAAAGTQTAAMTSETQPQPQLPAAQPTLVSTTTAEQQAGIDTRLSPQEKLALLEERLVKGEIDQDVYLNLKAKFELEEKPFEPAPQLPPPTTPISITQPTPIETVTPQPTITPTPETPPDLAPSPEPTVSEPSLPSDLPPDAYQQQARPPPQSTLTPQQVLPPQPTPIQPQPPQQPPAPETQPTTITTQTTDITQEQPIEAPTPDQPPPQPPSSIPPTPSSTLAPQKPATQQQLLTTSCPLCQKEIQEYTNPCPHCGGELQWDS
jgi:predicted GH43/DUF377 family glycosyl hydrolase